MKIYIDESKCQAHKRCFNLQPHLFEEGADEKGQVRAEVGILSEDDEVDAQTAANACPSGAIVIEY